MGLTAEPELDCFQPKPGYTDSHFQSSSWSGRTFWLRPPGRIGGTNNPKRGFCGGGNQVQNLEKNHPGGSILWSKSAALHIFCSRVRISKSSSCCCYCWPSQVGCLRMMMCMMISGMHMMIESRVYTQLSSNEGLTSMYWPSVGWLHSCGLTLPCMC